MGLYNGETAAAIKRRKNLKKSEDILDNMGNEELGANLILCIKAKEKLPTASNVRRFFKNSQTLGLTVTGNTFFLYLSYLFITKTSNLKIPSVLPALTGHDSLHCHAKNLGAECDISCYAHNSTLN